jgi:HAE1 family hydrophobic/amphiphilic exporter-1
MPMATAVIGGILVSTAFTLFVVPCAYSVLARWEGKPDDEENEFDDFRPHPGRTKRGPEPDATLVR